jgi:hypothetical protein
VGCVVEAEHEARVAWRGKAPCPSCGVPLSGVRAEQREEGGHAVVHTHPDGTQCEQRNRRT